MGIKKVHQEPPTHTVTRVLEKWSVKDVRYVPDREEPVRVRLTSKYIHHGAYNRYRRADGSQVRSRSAGFSWFRSYLKLETLKPIKGGAL